MRLQNVNISRKKVARLMHRFRRSALLYTSVAALTPAIALAQPAPPAPDASAAAATFPAPPPPPVAKSGSLQDVVITARHRAERAQTVPISMTVVGTQQLKNLGALNLDQIKQLVPSLTVNAYNPRNIGLDIRSLGSVGFFGYDGLEGGVGVYIDGVLLGRSTETNFDLPDLQDIEVLRGPQGTLFGKNTVAGAVVINTKLPSFKPYSTFSASLGDYNYWKLQAYTTGAIGNSDKAAFSLSAHGEQNDGYVLNTANGSRYQNTDDKGVRGQILLQPNDRLTVRIIANYDHADANCCVNIPTGVVGHYANGVTIAPSILNRYATVGYKLPTVNPFDRQTDIDSWNHYAMETAGLSAQADYDLDGFTLTSITAGSYYNWYPHLDGDGVGIPILTAANNTTHQRQFSQEFRITSPTGGKIDYTAGLFGFYQQLNDQALSTYGSDAAGVFLNTTKGATYAVTQLALNGFSNAATDIPSTYSYAAYGQATYHITPQIDFTGGARVTYEDKTGEYYTEQQGGVPTYTLPKATAAAVQATRNAYAPVTSYTLAAFDTLPGGLATLSYKPEPNILSYVTYAYGEKSAGLNFVTSAAVPKIVQPESVTNYEIGTKTTLLNGNLLLNADLFLEQDKNYQSTIFGPTGVAGTLTAYLANVPEVRSQGVEIDSKYAVTNNLNLFFSGIYNEAYYQSNPSSPCPIELQYPGHSKSCDLTGQPIAGSSKWTGSIGGEYDQPLPPIQGHDTIGYLGGNVLLKTGFYSTGDDSQYGYVPGYAVGNLTFGVRTANGRWDLSGWIHNITDAHYYIFRQVTNSLPGYNLVAGEVAPPLTFGVTLAAKF